MTACDLDSSHPAATLQLDGDPPTTEALSVTPITLCYLCGSSLMALLSQQGYSNLKLTALSVLASQRAQAAQAAQAKVGASGPNQRVTNAATPGCDMRQSCGGVKPGVFRVDATDAASQPFTVRCCTTCLYSVCDSLRDDYTNIRITTPEQPKLAAWKH